MRRMISLWLPRFATDRTGRATPALRDRPFAQVVERRARPTLHAVNHAAGRAGLAPGMALAKARAILPSLTILPACPNDDSRALARLAGWCGRYSPWTAACDARGEIADAEPRISLEGAGGGGLWIDASGCAHLFGGEAAMLEDITNRIARSGYAVRAAMADTPGCAWAVARFTATVTPWAIVPPDDAEAALAPLPVAALRLSAATVSGLHGLGIHKVSDLLALPPAPLAARFGKGVRVRLDATLGRTAEPISPALPEARHLARLRFAEPVGRIEDIAAALDGLLDDLCRGLERAGRGARHVALMLYQPDGTMTRLAIGTARPNRTPSHLARLFAGHLDNIDFGFGIEDAVLAATITDPLGTIQTGFDRTSEDGNTESEALDALIDRLANRLGPANVLRPIMRQSHLPERAAGMIPVAAGKKNPVASGDPVWAPPNPRPARLLRPPEPVEAIADSAGGGSLRQFRWRRVLHRIARIEGPERIAPEWWREDPGKNHDADDGTRDYYRIEDTHGRRFWLYRESVHTGPAGWYLHGLFG
ncbi:MAG: Y-family DNA polymerase [Alphaproteobacteria bacterium]